MPAQAEMLRRSRGCELSMHRKKTITRIQQITNCGCSAVVRAVSAALRNLLVSYKHASSLLSSKIFLHHTQRVSSNKNRLNHSTYHTFDAKGPEIRGSDRAL